MLFDSGRVVSVARAAELLGYKSRSTVYNRIRAGDLEATVDDAGRTLVLETSIDAYLRNPPSGSWSREAAPASRPTSADAAAALSEVTQLRSENMRLREVLSRLQLVRENEASARRAETEAHDLLLEAFRRRGEALTATTAATNEMDELIATLLPPHEVPAHFAEPLDRPRP